MSEMLLKSCSVKMFFKIKARQMSEMLLKSCSVKRFFKIKARQITSERLFKSCSVKRFFKIKARQIMNEMQAALPAAGRGGAASADARQEVTSSSASWGQI